MRFPVRIRWLLLGMNALVVFVPIIVLGTLRVYDVYLMRQTERQLIAQSVVIAETWRDAYNTAAGQDNTVSVEVRSPEQQSDKYAPIEPQIDLGVDVLPPEPKSQTNPDWVIEPAEKAGAAVQDMLGRTQIFNLTALRVLDAHGCVVATTGGDDGHCLQELPEVQKAIAGAYASVARRRYSDEPPPPLGDTRRRGDVRVYTALPVFQDGNVIGVVRAARTSLSALESLWLNRRGILLAFFASVMFAVMIALLSSKAIASPLRRIVRAAETVAKSGRTNSFRRLGWLPEEFRVLTNTLERMARQLDAKASYTAEYAANVSHELKTPITGIQGASELLAEQWNKMSEDQRQRFLTNIQKDAKRISALASNLLKLARIENAIPAGDSESIDVGDFFTELAGLYGDRVVIVTEQLPTAFQIDPNQLQSAVCNLIDNALQHGEGKPEVHAQGVNGRLEIRVTNAGDEIPEEHRSVLFDRFFSTRREDGGTGLGLAIVRAIADSRGGDISLTSKPGETVFTLVL